MDELNQPLRVAALALRAEIHAAQKQRTPDEVDGMVTRLAVGVSELIHHVPCMQPHAALSCPVTVEGGFVMEPPLGQGLTSSRPFASRRPQASARAR